MRLPSPLAALVVAVAAGLAEAQYLVNELSFGHTGRIETSSGLIPNFQLTGTPSPQLLSNKVVLTPPGYRNSRASIWGNAPLQHRSWVADVDFRATGSERGGGNLNIWLVRNGADVVGTSSIYTVGKFDGLALVVNSQGGTAGMVRGFLNDGTTDYSARSSGVDELAFGHCQYAYRNLGRPSQIKLRQNAQGFKVEVDGRLCFQTDKFSIPTGYKFGMTAATPDNPDSFEVFKMVVMSENTQPDADDGSTAGIRMNSDRVPPTTGYSSSSSSSDEDMADQDADLFTTSKAQFADLHNRLQGINRQITTVLRQVGKSGPQDEARHAETSKMIHDLTDEVRRLAGIEADLGMRVSSMEKEVKALKGAIHSRVAQSEHVLKGYLVDQHATLSETVLDHARGKHLRLIFIIVGSQVLLVGLFVLYKRKKNSLPKKFL
jgi:mannose-binding lectin 1